MNIFLSLLCYVPYIIDEKQKIQRFLSYLPLMFKERIVYDIPKTIEKAMRKTNLCYDQNKNKRENIHNWKIKDMNILTIKRKVLTFLRTLGIIIGDTKGKFLKIINNRILQQ